PPPSLRRFPYTTLFRSPNIGQQSRIGVRNIEPPAMPTLQRVSQGQTNVLGRPTMSQLNRSSSNYNWPSFLPSHHLEEMAEQCKIDRKSTRLNSSQQIIS